MVDTSVRARSEEPRIVDPRPRRTQPKEIHVKSVAATALAVIVAAGSISAQETQTAGMAWSLKAGDQFSTKVTIDIELGMELPGLPMGGGDQGFHVEYQLDHKVGESVDVAGQPPAEA